MENDKCANTLRAGAPISDIFHSFYTFRTLAATRFRDSGDLAIKVVMLVPKASMHKDDLLSSSKNNIRLPREILAVEPVPVSKAIYQLPRFHLRGCIF